MIFRRNLRSAFAWACLTLMAGALLAEEATRRPSIDRPLAERQPLLIGATSDSSPYGYLDEKGRWTGFAVDLFDAVARVMKLETRRIALPGREQQERFRAGEFDALQALSQTADREAYADFSVPYLILRGTVFVRKKDSPIKALTDFNGRKFAIIGLNSIGEKFLRDYGLHPEKVYVNSSEEGLRAVDRGECSGVFVANLTALTLVERAQLRNVAMFQEPFENYDIRHCFAVHKGDAQLLARLNEGLATLQRTGEYREIYDRWFGRFDSPVLNREQVVTYGLVFLTVALLVAIWGWHRQGSLRKRIAKQADLLSGQQALLRALYDNIPQAMCVFELAPDGPRVLSLNRQAEADVGVPAAEIVGQPWSHAPADSEWCSVVTELLYRHANNPALIREERTLSATRRRLFFIVVSLSHGPTGARLCVLSEDVTERRNLDDEVAQSRRLRALGELVGGIAHEFNNLLTPVMLKVSELQLDRTNDPRLQDDLGLITVTVRRAADLTRRLLAFGRKAEEKNEPVALAAIVDGCVTLLRQTVDRRIGLERNVPADLPPLNLSATSLNQILLNLLLNARDTVTEKLAYRSEGWAPRIRIEVVPLATEATHHLPKFESHRPIAGWQRLTVRDNGMGMNTETRERMFEPFFTTKEVGRGTGLGLATVWHLVTEMNGRIEVESTVGEGSAFHIYLPMVPAATPARATPSTDLRPAGFGTRIFLAEDDEFVAKAVTTILNRQNHLVTHIADGAQAWHHLERHAYTYQLVVLDINMPGMDGLELARRLRRTARYGGKLLIISGRLASDEMEQLAKLQVHTILPKPFAVADFLEAMNSALQEPSTPKPNTVESR